MEQRLFDKLIVAELFKFSTLWISMTVTQELSVRTRTAYFLKVRINIGCFFPYLTDNRLTDAIMSFYWIF